VKLLRRKRSAEIKPQITPLIDVVFLLIIFFMVVSEFSRLQSEEMMLPESERGMEIDKMAPGRVTVNILGNADTDPAKTMVVVESRWMGLKEFRDKILGREVATRGGPQGVMVFIRADRDTDFQAIKNVMKEMARVGILRVNFAVSDAEAEPE